LDRWTLTDGVGACSRLLALLADSTKFTRPEASGKQPVGPTCGDDGRPEIDHDAPNEHCVRLGKSFRSIAFFGTALLGPRFFQAGFLVKRTWRAHHSKPKSWSSPVYPRTDLGASFVAQPRKKHLRISRRRSTNGFKRSARRNYPDALCAHLPQQNFWRGRAIPSAAEFRTRRKASYHDYSGASGGGRRKQVHRN
jgi:hypothetical protein